MIPVSQINIGGDPLLNTQGFNIEEQLRQLELRRQSLESMKQLNPQAMPTSVIWNEIDTEVKVLSQEQLQKLFENEDYVKTYSRIQELVNSGKYEEIAFTKFINRVHTGFQVEIKASSEDKTYGILCGCKFCF